MNYKMAEKVTGKQRGIWKMGKKMLKQKKDYRREGEAKEGKRDWKGGILIMKRKVLKEKRQKSKGVHKIRRDWRWKE
jgi:hypothetical protein